MDIVTSEVQSLGGVGEEVARDEESAELEEAERCCIVDLESVFYLRS